MKERSNSIATICEVGMFAAIGYIIDELQGILSKSLFVNGGSIGFAMIAVIIIAYRRGLLPALLTGLIMGLLDLATGSYILHPIQMLLDYVFPYAIVGLVGIFRPMFLKTDTKGKAILWIIIGTIAGGLFKLMSHYLAGICFWNSPSSFAWNMSNVNVYLYCLIYNIAFIGPTIVLSGSILVALFIRAPHVFTGKRIGTTIKEKSKNSSPILAFLYIGVGALVFVYYFVQYIKSFEDYTDGSAYGYDFNPDSMMFFVLGLLLLALGVISIIRIKKETSNYKLSLNVLGTLVLGSSLYTLSRLIRFYLKGKDTAEYRLRFGISLMLLIVTALLYMNQSQKKEMGD